MVIFITAGTGLYFCRGRKMTKSTTAKAAISLLYSVSPEFLKILFFLNPDNRTICLIGI
jgi:uncharacterized membrane protein